MPLFGPPNVAKLLAKRDVKGLIKALGHRDPRVSGDAERALGEIGEAAVPPLLTLLQTDGRIGQDRVLAALERIGAPAVEPLLAVFRHKDPRMRRKAATALGKIGAPALEPLLNALTDDDRNVRAFATIALGMIGDARALNPLAQVLTDENQDEGTRREAAEALGKIGDSRAIEPLSVALLDESWVRSRAYRALEELGVRFFSRFTIEEKRQLVELSGPYLAGEKARRAGNVKVVDLSGEASLVQRLSDAELNTLIAAESLMRKADASSGMDAIHLYMEVITVHSGGGAQTTGEKT